MRRGSGAARAAHRFRLRASPLIAVSAVAAISLTPTPIARSSTSKTAWWMSKSSADPGRLVPSRASAPGTDSRYQAKSSPPRLCGAGAEASGPEHPLGGRLDHRRGHGSFTVGGTFRR